MSNYQGPATLIAGESAIDVHATLSSSRSGEVREWGGSVQTGGATEDFFVAMEHDAVRLRLPDGREGVVVATRTAIGSGRLRVRGNGAIPF